MLFTREKVGFDLKLNSDYDLQVTAEGQLDYVSGHETILQAVIRRIATDYSGYARMVRFGDQTPVLNASYGSELTALLSSSVVNDQEMLETVQAAATLDNRVDVLDAFLESDVNQSTIDNTVSLELTYRVKAEYQSYSAQIPLQARVSLLR